MIRFCVGEKGSRRAVAEWWCDEQDVLHIVQDIFNQCASLTLAQVFGANENFIRQYERL